MKRRIWLVTIALLSICGACVFLYALKLGFTESLISRRGSFAHFVTITEPVIGKFPLFSATDEPLYLSCCGDGPKAPSQAISYRSSLSPAELLRLASAHVISHGYAPCEEKGSFPGLAFNKGSDTLYLNITTESDGSTSLSADVIYSLSN